MDALQSATRSQLLSFHVEGAPQGTAQLDTIVVVKSAERFRLAQNLSVMLGSQAHFIAQVRLSATSRMPLYRSGPCALAASGKRRDIAMGIAVHPGDIVSPDNNGVMVMPKATSGAAVKIAAVRDEKETGVIRGPLDGGDIPELSGMKHLRLRPGVPLFARTAPASENWW